MLDDIFGSADDSQENDGELISALERYLNALKGSKLEEIVLSQEEFEYIIDYFDNQNNLEAVLKAAEFGLNRHPMSFEIMVRYIDALISFGRCDKALETLEKYINIFSNYPDIYFLQSRAYINKGDFAKARGFYLEALDKEENREDVLSAICCLAQDCIDMNNFDEAIYYFEKALLYGDLPAIFLNDFAYCFDRTQNLEKAIKYYNEYLDKDPFNDNVWFNLGTVYARKNNTDDAIEAFDYSLALNHRNESAVYNLATLYLHNEDYEQALKYFEMYCALDSKSAIGYIGFGNVYLALNKIDKAIEYYSKALEHEPNNHDVIISLNCLSALEDWERGDKKSFEKKMKMAIGAGDKFVEILNSLLFRFKNKDLEDLSLIKNNKRK